MLIAWQKPQPDAFPCIRRLEFTRQTHVDCCRWKRHPLLIHMLGQIEIGWEVRNPKKLQLQIKRWCYWHWLRHWWWTRLWQLLKRCQSNFCQCTSCDYSRETSPRDSRMGFGPWGWDLGLKTGIWASRRRFGSQSGIWSSRVGFGPQGWDLGLKAGIWALRLGGA